MKKYLIQFKPFLVFLSTFFFVYIALTLLYKVYLDGFKAYEVDGITSFVGRNVEQVLKGFNYDVEVQGNSSDSWLEVFLNNEHVVRIIEGCNAVSIMILFISFIIAFSGKLKTTLLYVLFGVTLIYILNVLRIAVLTVLLFHFSQYTHFLHGVLFPLVIYSSVFILWFVWVNKFSKYAK